MDSRYKISAENAAFVHLIETKTGGEIGIKSRDRNQITAYFVLDLKGTKTDLEVRGWDVEECIKQICRVVASEFKIKTGLKPLGK